MAQLEENRFKPNSGAAHLLDYFITLVRHKRLIMSITFGAALVTAVISLLMTPVYTAKTRIMPSPSEDRNLLSFGGLGGLAAGMQAQKQSDIFCQIIGGRTLEDAIIDRFGLMKEYGVKYKEDARSLLSHGVLSAIPDEKSGIVTISVEDKAPAKAAQMANAVVEELETIMKGMAVSDTAQMDQFFEAQMKTAQESLTRSENQMQSFQERSGVVDIGAQSKAVIQSIANLKSKIMAEQTQIGVMKTYSAPNNPELQRMEVSLHLLRAQLTRMETKGTSGDSYGNPIIATGNIPAIETEYENRERTFKQNEALYDALIKGDVAAKLVLANQGLVQVVDKAVMPVRRTRPKRALMVIMAAFTAFFFSVLLVFILEWLKAFSKKPDISERLLVLKKNLGLKWKRFSQEE